MLELDGTMEEWNARKEPTNRPCDNFNVGREGLQRVGAAIGPQTFIPICFAIISNFLSKKEWKAKYAALMALSEFAHLLPDDTDKLKAVVDQVVVFTKVRRCVALLGVFLFFLGGLCISCACRSFLDRVAWCY
mgnify:CR=1 FL=1